MSLINKWNTGGRYGRDLDPRNNANIIANTVNANFNQERAKFSINNNIPSAAAAIARMKSNSGTIETGTKL